MVTTTKNAVKECVVIDRQPDQEPQELRQRAEEEWNRLHQRVIDATISEWRKRLQACMQLTEDISSTFNIMYVCWNGVN